MIVEALVWGVATVAIFGSKAVLSGCSVPTGWLIVWFVLGIIGGAAWAEMSEVQKEAAVDEVLANVRDDYSAARIAASWELLEENRRQLMMCRTYEAIRAMR